MNFYTIRLKRHPALYIGKTNCSYAIMSDQEICKRFDTKIKKSDWPNSVDEVIQIDAQWFTKEKYAKVWTDLKMVKRLFSFCNSLYDDFDDGKKAKVTFSEYEILENGKPIEVDFL